MDQPEETQIKNPFQHRFGPEFYKRIPNAQGVYWLLNHKRQILFVSQSTDLRQSIESYRQVKVYKYKKWLFSLFQQVHDVQWSTCDSVMAARALEKELVDRFSPAFNQKKVPVAAKWYIGYFRTSDNFYFAIKDQPLNEYKTFGPFKGKAPTFQAYSAILRSFWRLLHDFSGLPAPLVKNPPPERYAIPIPSHWQERHLLLWSQQLEGLLENRHDFFIESFRLFMTNHLLDDNFNAKWVVEDLDHLSKFFTHVPQPSTITEAPLG